MVEKQASACTCHCILRYCNETDFIYHDRCETFCHLRVCLFRFVKLSMLCSAGPTCPHLLSTVSFLTWIWRTFTFMHTNRWIILSHCS